MTNNVSNIPAWATRTWKALGHLSTAQAAVGFATSGLAAVGVGVAALQTLPWPLAIPLFLSAMVLVFAALVYWQERRERANPSFDVTVRTTEDQKWIRLEVTNRGASRQFSAQVLRVEGTDLSVPAPWFIRWRDSVGIECQIAKGETRHLDLAQADPMGGEGSEPWEEGQPLPESTEGWGRFRFHTPSTWVPLRVGPITRGTEDLYTKRLTAIVEVRSGTAAIHMTLRIGYDNMLNILTDVGSNGGTEQSNG